MKTRKHFISGVLVALGLILIGPFSSYAAPDWSGAEPGLGAQAVDGSLRLDLPLGVLPGGQEFAFPLTLHHDLEARDQEPAVVTRWSIPQLITYVVPGKKESVVWIQPGGDQMIFEKDEVLSSLPERFSREWVCLSKSADVHEMVSRDGWIYQYKKGILQSLEAPSGRKLTFDMDRTRMLSATLQARSRVLEVLSVEWSEDGRPLAVRLGPVEHRFTYEEVGKKGSGDFRLVEWLSNTRPGSPVRFEYQAGLLAKVDRDAPGDLTFEWTVPGDGWISRHQLDLPEFSADALIARVGDDLYRMSSRTNGVELTRENAAGEKSRLEIDFRSGESTLVRPDGSAVTRVYYGRSSGAASGKIQRIDSPGGIALVRVKYNEFGDVLAVKRAGRATEVFQYD
ncbi:MAG: hypothetical protein ACQKBT_11615, partial [Puniceicoccales bacterium]